DFVDEDVGDDFAQRVGVLGPVVENGAAVEPDAVGHLAGLRDDAVIGQTDALEQAHQIEGAVELHILADLFGGKFGDPAFDVARHGAEGLGEGLQGLDGERLEIIEGGGRERPPEFGVAFGGLAHYCFGHSRMSTKWPRMAAAAAMMGLTRCVRPLKPWRPSKLRFEVEAQRSPGASLSGFMARHIEQPGSRHSKPASTKILSSPSASAWALTSPDPGTTMALTRSWTLWPLMTAAAARRSSMRPLVHEPRNTRSSSISVIFVPGTRPMYSSARFLEARRLASSMSSGSGTAPRTEITSSGDEPQETIGGRLAASSTTSLSKVAPSSVKSVFQ